MRATRHFTSRHSSGRATDRSTVAAPTRTIGRWKGSSRTHPEGRDGGAYVSWSRRKPGDRSSQLVDHGFAAVALLGHHDQFAGRPDPVELPGCLERQADIELPVNEHARDVRDARHSAEKALTADESGVFPIVNDQRRQDLPELRIVETLVRRQLAIERHKRVLPRAPGAS